MKGGVGCPFRVCDDGESVNCRRRPWTTYRVGGGDPWGKHLLLPRKEHDDVRRINQPCVRHRLWQSTVRQKSQGRNCAEVPLRGSTSGTSSWSLQTARHRWTCRCGRCRSRPSRTRRGRRGCRPCRPSGEVRSRGFVLMRDDQARPPPPHHVARQLQSMAPRSRAVGRSH